jgi:PAS domain-containing protein
MPDFLKNITPTEFQFLHYGLLILISLGTILVGVLGRIFGRAQLKAKAFAVLKTPWTALKLVVYMAQFPAMFAAYSDERKNEFQSIQNQLTRKGGSSLRDSVDRIEQNQTIFSNKLRSVDDRAPQAIFEMNVREYNGERFFDCIYVNPAMCRMLGYPASHLLGMNLISKVEETERETFLGLWNIALKTGSTLESRHHIQHGENRQLLHVKFVAQPQKDATGRLCHYYGHLEYASRSNT